MEDVKTKREARRRKILENSEKRLQKINQCKLEENENITPKWETYIPAKKSSPKKSLEVKQEALTSESNLNANEVLDTLKRTGYLADDFNEIRNENTANSRPNRIPQVHERIWKKLGFKLAILAIIVRIIHIFKLGYLFGETIVIPFAIFMMTQLGNCQFDQKVTGITGPVLIFMGISPTTLKKLLLCYNVVTSILVYFAIYFFSFISVHLIFVMVLGL